MPINTGLRTHPAVAPPAGLPRLFPAQPDPALRSHLDRFGPLPGDGARAFAMVEASGLKGHGGAGFPAAVKLQAVARGRNPIVVANGTEGEPASAKDKTLLTYAPHLVLDGAMVAARIVGASEVVICLDRQATAVIAAVERAIAERGVASLDAVSIRVAATPSRYIAGEETALVHWLNGGEAKPTFTPPRPFERGVRGRPTLVQNVETLAHIALIARFGPEWFRTIGTASEPGSMLVTMSGGATHGGVYEVPLGAALPSILRAGGADAPPAVLVGGYFGTWITARQYDSVALSAESLRPHGASLGCGVLFALPKHACGLAESARVTRWLAGQTAEQCGPCVNGLAAIADAMDSLVAGKHSDKAERQLHRWIEMVQGRGACKHPDGAARFVGSSLRAFSAEIAAHRQRGACPASAHHVLPLPAPEGFR